jgi:adenylate cyclase
LGIALGKGSVDESNLVESLNNLIYWGDTIARSYGGVLDKVIEDTLMLVFRDSNEILAPQAVRGASAIIQIKEQLKALGIKTYAGIASGMVVSGKIGSRLGKLDYTVIGDTVNMAARLKGISSSFNEGLTIVAPSTIRKLKGAGRVRFIARMPIKGKSREYPIYELISMR